jgi:DNA-binding ferritin-like protein
LTFCFFWVNPKERRRTIIRSDNNSYSDLLQIWVSNPENRKEVEIVVRNFSAIIIQEREILSLAADAEDEGTVTLLSDYITQTEKTLWMLNAYLN